MKQLIRALCLLSSVLLLPLSHAETPTATTPTPGQFDAYVLAMTYEVDFCATNPTRAECEDGLGRVGLVLHGLWPDKNNDPKHTYQYCGTVKEEQVKKDWCATDIDVRSQMSPSVYLALSLVMPGAESCLYNHEWYAHGTCSGMSVNDYFNIAAGLAGGFRKLGHFEAFLVEHAGQTVTRKQLLDSLTQDFGDKTGDAAIFLCREDKHTKQYYFTEVDLTLLRETIGKFPAPESLGSTPLLLGKNGDQHKNQGNCPETGILVSP